MWQIEYTDTFSGEANYAWVKRASIPERKGESQRGIMRRAKAVIGLTGVKGRTISYGDSFEFRPFGSCTVLFVT